LPAAWDTHYAELHFAGSSSHTLTTPGIDLGANFAGYDANFAWGMLAVSAGESLLIRSADTAPAAVYVHDLLLAGGADQIPLLSTGDPGVVIYYDATRPANAYLDWQTYTLVGGGSLTPVPEPAAASLMALAAATLFAGRRRRRQSALPHHTIRQLLHHLVLPKPHLVAPDAPPPRSGA
jgi:hypothetical protein